MNQMYYLKPERNEMTTTIKSAEQRGDHWYLELEDTLFYPEGGGQPADKGSLNDLPVLDVQKEEGRILHKLGKRPEETEARLSLDRSHRDHYRIQHTGQHLISSLLQSLCGAATLSVHLGRDECSIETDRDDISMDELYSLEEEGARLIAAGLPVRSLLVNDREELEGYRLRRPTDKTENIRLVSIGENDITPCGGLHADSTADLEMIKYAGSEKVRGHMRLKWKIGAPAREDYRRRMEQSERMGKLLSTPALEAADRLEDLLEEKRDEKRRLKTLEEETARRISGDLASSLTAYPPLVIRKLEDCPSSLFRLVCRDLSARTSLSFLLCSEEGGRLNWSLHLPCHKAVDFNEFREKCLSLIEGKGGGRGPLWQGSGSKAEMADDFLRAFRTLCLAD